MVRFGGLVAFAVLCAGCFGPDITPGLACSPDGECPPGQTCNTATGICEEDGVTSDPDARPRAVDSGVPLDDGGLAACNELTDGYQGEETGHCYYRESTSESWLDGRAACGAIAGSHLVAYETAAEQAEIEAHYADSHWLGLADRGAAEGTFRWQTGPTTDPAASWASPDPDDDVQVADEDCVWSELGAGFRDAVCDAVVASVASRICEIEPAIVNSFNDHEYQIIYADLLPADAAARCEALGGHLVTIGSQGEMDFIQSFSAGLELWIDLSDVATEGTFVWGTGEALAYENWETGEPGAADTAENCVYKHGDGQWDDWECDRASYGALCEIE